MESFSQYQPLFSEAINSNRIGVCKWIESGTTIGTALPELGNLTDDKKEWRAVIVRYIDDNCMAAFESDSRNPYDFLLNKEAVDVIEESPIPLVRLTQMLGGVPPLEVKFKPEVIRETHKAPRTVYVPIEDEQREQKHKELVRKYRFDGKAPSAILIISIRNKSYQEESIGRTWIAHKESESSDFWKRNQFPSVCRFMAFDFGTQGPIQKEADCFGFWYSVMLLSINEWDSSTIQAYRLYSLGVTMDSAAMSESFQMLADRLRDAKHSIDKSIKKDIENHICEEEELPEYRLEIPVALKLPKTEECLTKKKSFPLLSNGSAADVSIWFRQRSAAENELAISVRSAERTLDQTADKMRSNCTFTEDEVFPLNKYQVEDLTRETDEIYQQIVCIQGTLPNNNISKNEIIQNAAEKVKKNLLGRVMKKPAIISLIIVTLIMFMAVIPAITDYFAKDVGSLSTLVHALLCCIVFVILCAMCTLLMQKAKLGALIEAYNQHLKNAFNNLVENAGDYSTYMSGIASHSRGRSYLNISDRKMRLADTEHFSKYKHIKAINVLLSKLSAWSKAYHLEVDFISKRPETRIEIDITTSPTENKLYAFETGEMHPVAINNSGMSMGSPYRFASQIEIVREELYEDE